MSCQVVTKVHVETLAEGAEVKKQQKEIQDRQRVWAGEKKKLLDKLRELEDQLEKSEFVLVHDVEGRISPCS